MFKKIKEEYRKDLFERANFKFINEPKGIVREEGFRAIFDKAYLGNRRVLARINNWIKKYSLMEKEAICSIAYEYKRYYLPGWNYIDFLKAIKFVVNIQSGMSRFDSYINVFYNYDEVEKYLETNDKESKRKIMVSVASYCNSKIIITLAQALDAPIQISYQGYKHQMIEVLRDIAVNGTSQRERVNAANSLLQHLNPNEISALQINIGVQKKEKSFIEQAQDALKLIANKKLEDIKAGTKAEDIINVDIIEEAKELEQKEENGMTEEEQKIYKELEEQNLIDTEEQDGQSSQQNS